MKKNALWVVAILASWLCVSATIDVWLQPEVSGVTSADSGDDIIPIIKNGGGSGSVRKIRFGNLVPKPTDAGLTNDVYISLRTDGKSGDGTQRNPFDGSTRAKFEAILAALPTSVTIHLGPGTFQVTEHDAVKTNIKSGQVLEGAGQNRTTIQLSDNLAGIHYAVAALTTGVNNGEGYDQSIDNVTIKNLTIDCNFPGLASMIDDGSVTKSASDGVTVSGSATIQSATIDFHFGDIFCTVTGMGVPANARILRIPTTQIISGDGNQWATSGYAAPVLPQAVLAVSSTTDFASSGTLLVESDDGDFQPVTYTGKTSSATLLTGVTTTVGSNLFTKTAHGLTNGQAVIPNGFANTTGYTGLINGLAYFVIGSTSNTFQLSASYGGAAVPMGGSADNNVTIAQAPSFTGCSGGYGAIHSLNQVTTRTQAVITTDYATPANATASGSSITFTVGGHKRIAIAGLGAGGNHINVEHVTVRNTYGSTEDSGGHECFPIYVTSGGNVRTTSGVRDSEDDHIRWCRVELPYGNYSDGISLGGLDYKHRLLNSSIEYCTVVGIHNGRDDDGYSNYALGTNWSKSTIIVGNQMTDTGFTFYCDTGSIEDLLFTANQVYRGGNGIRLVQTADPTWINNRVKVIGNYFGLQNRTIGSGDCENGIRLTGTSQANCDFIDNWFSYRVDGLGGGSGHYILAQGCTNLKLINNTQQLIGTTAVPGGMYQNAQFDSSARTGLQKFMNRKPDGTQVDLAAGDALWNNLYDTGIAAPAARTFANLPPSPVEGQTVPITDSNTATFNATIAGGGSNHVSAYYNGTSWTVH